jgi:hypothetical protein
VNDASSSVLSVMANVSFQSSCIDSITKPDNGTTTGGDGIQDKLVITEISESRFVTVVFEAGF